MSDTGSMVFSADWDELLDALDPNKFSGRIKQESRTLMRRIGRIARRNAIGIIRAGAYHHNAPMTIAEKGSSLPLVDHGDLIQSIGFAVETGDLGVSGLILGANKRSEKGWNVAETLHEGTKPGTRPKIPARPFLQLAISTDKFKAEANAEIAKMMAKIMAGKKAARRKKFAAGIKKRFGI